MIGEKEPVKLPLNDFDEPGLYLLFPDQSRMVITREKIEQFSKIYLEDPAKVPPSVKAAADFESCEICPQRGSGEFCVALRPVLPFLEIDARHVSFDPVTVVYREKKDGLIYVKDTTLQRALQYLSVLSLIHYCEIGGKYLKYFLGVIPLMDTKEIIEKIYLNIYWFCQGDEKKKEEAIAEFVAEIKITASCQIRRLNTICKNDPFLNAFVVTQAATELLSMLNRETLKKSFEAFEKK